MNNINKTIAKLTVVVTIMATFVMPIAASAAEFGPSSVNIDPWVVSTLAKDAGSTRIEAYKVDQNLVAWTEVNGATRSIYAYDGVRIRTLASFDVNNWSNDGAGFYDAVNGNFDVADGRVVWTMSDGHDREIYAFDGESVKKVSNNSYDDRHPIVSNGRVAWTSQPPGSQYNLMMQDGFGTRLVDSWHVGNYAFSGTNLFWLNKLGGENWFRVFVNTGLVNSAVGEGDDRPIADYFIVDGKGSATWEYSTKQWSYDKRKVYLSNIGAPAIMVIQRDVPPTVTRVEDMNEGIIMMNLTDLLLTDLPHKATLLKISGGAVTEGVFRKESASKVRFMDGGYVRQREPGANITMVFHADNGSEDIITADAVIQDRFAADGGAAAGARVGGGLVTYVNGKGVVIPSNVEASSLKVKNGDVAWIEGKLGSQVLKAATRTVLVKSGYGAQALSGHLVKTSSSNTVYFAAADGKRYAFYAPSQYFSWFADFRGVQTLSVASVAAMPLGGNVLFRPDSILVKAESDSRVYALGKNGTLHWITSEDVVLQRYGAGWKSRLVTIDATMLADYNIGQAIATGTNFVNVVTL